MELHNNTSDTKLIMKYEMMDRFEIDFQMAFNAWPKCLLNFHQDDLCSSYLKYFIEMESLIEKKVPKCAKNTKLLVYLFRTHYFPSNCFNLIEPARQICAIIQCDDIIQHMYSTQHKMVLFIVLKYKAIFNSTSYFYSIG